jgi:hypothetical protein
MLPKGICGETVRRVTVDREVDELPDDSVRIKGKAFRKLGERDLF